MEWKCASRQRAEQENWAHGANLGRITNTPAPRVSKRMSQELLVLIMRSAACVWI